MEARLDKRITPNENTQLTLHLSKTSTFSVYLNTLKGFIILEYPFCNAAFQNLEVRQVVVDSRTELDHTCQLSRFYRESPSFSSNLPVSRLEHQISRENPRLLSNSFFFINFVVFKMSKRKIKQDVYSVLFFELFTIGKRKTENRAVKLRFI